MLQAKKGDVAAFRMLYERFKGPLMSYVYSFIADKEIAEDLTQEIFMRAFRSKDTYEASAKVSTWLWTIARNACIDHLRKKSNQEEAVGAGSSSDEEIGGIDLEQIEAPLQDAEASMIEQAREDQVQRCLGALPAQQREVLLLRTVSELSYEEIASSTGHSLSAVKSLIFRAKGSLMKCIGTGGKQK